MEDKKQFCLLMFSTIMEIKSTGGLKQSYLLASLRIIMKFIQFQDFQQTKLQKSKQYGKINKWSFTT